MSQCMICSSEIRDLVEFENFPNSAVFVSPERFGSFDNGQMLRLVQCKVCSHIQIDKASQVNHIYDDSYSYRTNSLLDSKIDSSETDLLQRIKRIIDEGEINCILEIGANNLSFLKNIGFQGKKIAVDPILKGVNAEDIEISNLEIIGQEFENIDPKKFENVDLFYSRHNLEHLKNPIEILSKIRLGSGKSNLFGVIEVPDTDMLVKNNRFDQIFHEHIHYFNKCTLETVIHLSGFDCLEIWESQRYGGSINALISSKCGVQDSADGRREVKELIKRSNYVAIEPKSFLQSYDSFSKKCDQIRSKLEDNYGNSYGFGAGHATPFLAYHIDGRFHLLEGIADNDKSKQGSFIKNLNPQIIDPEELDSENIVLVTSTDYTDGIVTFLKSKGIEKSFGLKL